MPRKPRVEYAGFHHLINRGVARGDIFLKEKDFEFFLEILRAAQEKYNFYVHSLCLMNNHYHLLLETKSENLSLVARHINSKYAQYFNREYKRVGPLWQGRFKSWYVHDEIYLDSLVRYIEQNPIKAGICQEVGAYAWSASSLLFNKKYEKLFTQSMLFNAVLFSSLDKPLSETEQKSLVKLSKITYKRETENLVREKQGTLDEYFKDIKDLKQRNAKIILAVKDGYKHSEIARYLNVTSPLISYVINNLKLNT